MVASQRGCCVRIIVDGRETFPGEGGSRVELVELGFPDASLKAIERGHVDTATTAPDIESVGVRVMDGSCTDAGYGCVGKRGGGIECALGRGGTEIEDMDDAVDGDARKAFARVEKETTGVCYGGTV